MIHDSVTSVFTDKRLRIDEATMHAIAVISSGIHSKGLVDYLRARARVVVEDANDALDVHQSMKLLGSAQALNGLADLFEKGHDCYLKGLKETAE